MHHALNSDMHNEVTCLHPHSAGACNLLFLCSSIQYQLAFMCETVADQHVLTFCCIESECQRITTDVLTRLSLVLADGRVIDTSQPTDGDPYIVVYTVTNSAGLSASVRRTVEVADPCPAQFGNGWAYCTSTGASHHHFLASSACSLLHALYFKDVVFWPCVLCVTA